MPARDTERRRSRSNGDAGDREAATGDGGGERRYGSRSRAPSPGERSGRRHDDADDSRYASGERDPGGSDRRDAGVASVEPPNLSGGDAHRSASDQHGVPGGGRQSDPGDAGRIGRGRTARSLVDHDAPGEGSQRGSHREQGIAGRLGGHRGDRDRAGRSDDRRGLTQPERSYGGDRGGSERDHRYGSRRGNATARGDVWLS